MTTFAVTAKRIDERTGVVSHVMWGEVQSVRNEWVVEPHLEEAIRVVDALTFGDTVVTIFEVDGQRVAGPHLRVMVDAHGHESLVIEPTELQPGRTMLDLPDC